MNMPDEKALRHLNDSLNLEPLWMPFTANRQFKAAPRLLVAAKDMHYLTQDGRKVLDGIAGLWAVNAGHCLRPARLPVRRASLILWRFHQYSALDRPFSC